MTVLVDQYWGGTEQKCTFTPDGGSTYTMVHNPTTYTQAGASQAEIEMPASVGISTILGGAEFAPEAIALEWEQMDSDEYSFLSSIQFQPCTFIDMEDNGYYGYLKLVNFGYLIQATKVGKVSAIFMAIAPAPGVHSTINTINPPGSVSTSISSGGSIGGTSDIQIYYALSFWSIWGETLVYPFSQTIPGHTPPHQDLVSISWNAPSSKYFRRARLYLSTDNSGPIAPGDTAYLLGDVFWAQQQSWTDYNGNVNGMTYPQIIVPSVNKAFKGYFGGGRWNNDN